MCCSISRSTTSKAYALATSKGGKEPGFVLSGDHADALPETAMLRGSDVALEHRPWCSSMGQNKSDRETLSGKVVPNTR